MAEGMINVGLYGCNGHQLRAQLVNNPRARLVAVAAIDRSWLPPELREDRDIVEYPSLEELLADRRVELVSLCSPRRRDQARHAIRALESGRHVYAEKPCAMSEADLDAILDTVRRTGRQFHEMAGTAFEQPFLAMRNIVAGGALGTTVQVLAQKSYPYHDGRPQDEDIDGGLILQAGVHALRMIEHVAGVRVARIAAVETSLGNPRPGGLRMAATMMMTLENGGVAAATANYLNPRGFGRWGNETLRIFGTAGMIEATDGGTRTRLIIGDRDCGALDAAQPPIDYFNAFVDTLLGRGRMPLSLDDELHPTRMVIRARESCRAAI